MNNLFLSKYINNLDKKGRVTVPSQYRNILVNEEDKSFIAYPSIKHPCIEGCSLSRMGKIYEMINNLEPYSEIRDAFETIILGGSMQILFDTEGRVVIPKELAEYANLKEQICFVGKGEIFEIWNPDDFAKYSLEAKKLAVSNKLLLKCI